MRRCNKQSNPVFSERELDHIHIRYMSSSIRLSLSSVCNVRAPHSGNWNFPQCFYSVWYLVHPLTIEQHFTEIVPGEPLRRGRVKRKRGREIQWFWTYRTLYLGNGARYDVSYY